MSHITKATKSIMIFAAGTVASILIAGNVVTTAHAATIIYDYEVSFREAKRMCNGIHGQIFETERAQYGCTGDLTAREPKAKAKKKRPPTSVPRAANDRPGKRQNFTGRKDFSTIGRVGGEGNGTGGNGGSGGGGGGGSAGGRY